MPATRYGDATCTDCGLSAMSRFTDRDRELCDLCSGARARRKNYESALHAQAELGGDILPLFDPAARRLALAQRSKERHDYVRDHIGAGETYAQVGRALGISGGRVQQIWKGIERRWSSETQAPTIAEPTSDEYLRLKRRRVAVAARMADEEEPLAAAQRLLIKGLDDQMRRIWRASREVRAA